MNKLNSGLTAYQTALALPDGVVRTAQVKATRDDLSSAFEQLARNLERGKDIWGRVRAIGPNNTASGWSDPATVMVA